MKTISFLAVALMAVIGTAFTTLTGEPTGEVVRYNVDLQKSNIVWKGYKVLGSHTGNINLSSGNLQFQDGMLTGGQFEIDMTSIVCNDLSGATADKLVGHLKSDDFFGAATYPTAKFTITNVYPNGVNRYKVTGNLTIKETTKEIKFIAEVKEEGDAVTATTDVQIDRSEYNVRYGSGTFFGDLGDNTIYDEFDLSISLTAAK